MKDGSEIRVESPKIEAAAGMGAAARKDKAEQRPGRQGDEGAPENPMALPDFGLRTKVDSPLSRPKSGQGDCDIVTRWQMQGTSETRQTEK